ncbi:helix-turn-helix domain-containing protein [Microbacterium paludicola]|uniref:helix-turn-helix domain-containing protein n=1 Tax=Microbacterium paludicola TaxID=300019 RepID=UPI003879350B
MSALLTNPLPVPSSSESAARVVSFIEAHEARFGDRPAPAYYLTGAEEHERVELDAQMFSVLRQVAEAMKAGRSVTVFAQGQQLTTQQAAEILGISRPTIVKLIEDGELPANVPGQVRRKLLLEDVIAYRERLYARRNSFIERSSRAYEDADAAAIAAALAEAREAH